MTTSPSPSPGDHLPAGPPPAENAAGGAAAEAVGAPYAMAEPDAVAETEASGAERTVLFSDAVVAIAITLLALELPLPHGGTNSALLRSLGSLSGDYGTFLISFAVIANHWSIHRRVFRYLGRLGGRVSDVNMLWLLMIVLMPFATRILRGDGGFAIRFTIYALVQVIAGACMLEISRELVAYGLLRPGVPDSVFHAPRLGALIIPAMFLVSIPVAFVTHWAYAIWVAIPVVLRVRWLVARRMQARRAVSGPTGAGPG